MILTKNELKDWLYDKVAPANLINSKVLFDTFITLLKWDDEDPRDINENDLYCLEQLVATEVDRLLTSIENDICNNDS